MVVGVILPTRKATSRIPSPLSAGHSVECPLHFAQFDVRDGKLVDGPVAADVPVYEVRVDGDAILVKR